MPLEGLQLGHYQLVRLLGSGGMGEVYLAEDIRINRQLAVKIVRTEADPYPDAHATREAARLFQREMKAITALDHPHILPLIDFGEQEVNKTTLTYMVMPFRQEGSLADWLRQRGTSDILTPQDVAHFLLQAADALQHAHDHQLIHQDVKPSNFLIRSRTVSPNHPDLLLADFGIAKFTTATATASQSIRGTPAYMAPEQWDGQPVAVTDQYALAIMAYQLLTGRPPFQGGPGQVMRQHYMSQPQPPSSLNPRLSPAVDAVILRALEKKPEDRFPTIAAFAQAFQAATQSTDAPSRAPTRPASGNTITGGAPSGANIRATLAISKTEALTGTSRTLTLPGGRQMTIAVPAGTQDGQVIYLGGQGEPSGSGGPTGSLILTVAIQQDETRPASDAESARETVRASNPSLQRQPMPALNPNLQRPPTLPASANLTSQGFNHRGEKNIASSLLRSRKVWLLGLVLLVVLGSLGVFYFGYFNIIQRNILLNSDLQNPYTASGTIALNDPLRDNSNGYFWGELSDNYGTCEFTEGTYHVSTSPGKYHYCTATSTALSNFAFEVQLRIINGDCGGLIFRSDETSGTFYLFQVCQDGSYALFVNSQILTSNSSSAIHAGLNQINDIAVVANGSMLDLYANQQKIDSVNDNMYSHGQVGVVAEAISNQTEVAFSNARVWTF
jgi:serine/threonine protein kinase